MAKVNESPHASTKDFTAQDTTDNWDELDTWLTEHLKSKTLHLRETGATNDVDIRVLGKLDESNTYPVVVQGQTTISAGGALKVTVPDYYTGLKVEVKAAAAGSQGTVAGDAAGIAA